VAPGPIVRFLRSLYFTSNPLKPATFLTEIPLSMLTSAQALSPPPPFSHDGEFLVVDRSLNRVVSLEERSPSPLLGWSHQVLRRRLFGRNALLSPLCPDAGFFFRGLAGGLFSECDLAQFLFLPWWFPVPPRPFSKMHRAPLPAMHPFSFIQCANSSMNVCYPLPSQVPPTFL